jgi:hypothetical protein
MGSVRASGSHEYRSIWRLILESHGGDIKYTARAACAMEVHAFHRGQLFALLKAVGLPGFCLSIRGDCSSLDQKHLSRSASDGVS